MSTHDGVDNDRDLLIARIIDGDAGAADWERFRAEASRDASVWRELSDAQADHEALREAVHAAEGSAGRVELPVSARVSGSHQRRIDAASRWSGWGVAAMLAAAWFVGSAGTGARTTTGAGAPSQRAGMIPASSVTRLDQATPEEALGRYMAAGRADGRVVGELPDPIIVETRPTGSGSVEVIYLRQIIERREVDRAYRRVTDEFGNPELIPVEFDALGADRAF